MCSRISTPVLNRVGQEAQWRFSEHVSEAEVEKLNVLVSQEGIRKLTLDLAGYKRSREFAESRLLGCLSLARSRGIDVSVRLGVRGPEGALQTPKYRKLFSESVSGLLFAHLSHQICDRSCTNDYTAGILEMQEDALREEHGLIGSGKEVSAPVIEMFMRPETADVVTEKDPAIFETKFQRLLTDHLGIKQPLAGIKDIYSFAYETLQNAREHGVQHLDGRPLPKGIKFLSLRRRNLSEEPLDDNRSTGRGGVVASYLHELGHELRDLKVDADKLIEITVADNGVGIPARMAGSMDIYSGPIEEERRYLLEALTPSGTSKSTAVRGAGLGLNLVMEATAHLRALILFRTGRLCMYKHYLGDKTKWPSTDLEEWEDSPCSLIAGTSVSLIIPRINATQASMELFSTLDGD